MERIVDNPAVIVAALFALGGLSVIALRLYGFFNYKAWKRQVVELRKRMDEMKPTDPEYNDAKALYMSLMNDAKMLDYHFAHDSAEGSHTSDHSGSTVDHHHHSDGHHSDGHSDGHH